ncbi:2-oxo acid dehydrogenase subunit E2, partial [Porticoccaceae bacterium]|nr:2-oxo acid dehydrogenase subunit E2 [Porticoccaceae bacterium]
VDKTVDAVTPNLTPTPAVVAEDRVEVIRGVGKIMAERMAESVATIPHFTFVDEVDVSELMQLRKTLNERYGSDELKITLMPLFIKALSLAVKEFPIINSRANADFTELTYLASHNIGMAVDGANGLLVPNIKAVEQRSIVDIASQVMALTAAARSGKINPADLKNGSITISNIGAIGGTVATPIINKPEVAIVALGKIQRLPRFDEHGDVVARNIMTVSWSGDHRVIDGGTIARFNNCWKSYLEQPATMLAAMV